MGKKSGAKRFLHGARAYLSGPMDFVASRADEKQFGWRVRVKAFLQSFGTIVFDPWEKPGVRGLHEYGREDVNTTVVRERWTFTPTREGAKARAEITGKFWETMHIDLRMVDVSDFVVAYCPTSVYSPVLLVSPPVSFPAIDALKARLAETGDRVAQGLLEEVEAQVPIKPNLEGTPSLWYMALVGGENFFDGFGFDAYRNEFKWPVGPPDERERQHPPKRPLLPFLAKIDRMLPRRWSRSKGKFVLNDDWLLLDLDK